MDRRAAQITCEAQSKFQLQGDTIYKELLNDDYLYPHQLQALKKARHYFSPGGRHEVKPRPFLIEAPTGKGKTGIICLLPYVLKCHKVLILSPSPAISEQIRKSYEGNDNFFLKVGILRPEDLGSCLESPKTITKSSQIYGMELSNMSRDHDEIKETKKHIKPFTTIIVDEAHHYPAPTWEAIVSVFSRKQIIFLTATPYHNGESIIPLNGDNHIKIPKSDIEGIYIRKSKFLDLPGIHEDINYFTPKNWIQIRRTIEYELEKHDRKTPLPERSHKALFLVNTKADAEILEDKLQCGDSDEIFAKRYNTDSNTKKNLEGFQQGKFPALILCGKLLEGYDNADISVCVIFRKVQSNLLFAQFVGRCLRMSSKRDKVVAKIFSVSAYNQEVKWNEYVDPCLAENDPEL